ncbi:MAG: hypothetical protein AB7I30_16515 [Isosphaeraceae bacterium]
MLRRTMVFGALVVVMAGPSLVVGADKPAVEARAAFDRLKTLAGDWSAVMEGENEPGEIAYRLTANDSVLMETLFPGTPHEMVTMYHLDGDELKLTHYCAAKNQPRLRLDRAASTADDLVFVFDGGTNFDPAKDMHMREARITFAGEGKVKSRWDAYQAGKLLHSASFTLTKPSK